VIFNKQHVLIRVKKDVAEVSSSVIGPTIPDTSKFEALSLNDSPSRLDSTDGYDHYCFFHSNHGPFVVITSWHSWMWFAQISVLIQELDHS
jgi:hypothetical protein